MTTYHSYSQAEVDEIHLDYQQQIVNLKDKLRRRNKQIKDLQGDSSILRMKINAWEEKYGEIEDLTEQR